MASTSAAPWVFHHDIDRRHAKAGERLASLRRAFAGAVDRAKLPADLNQHDLRHRRVTTWLAEGKPAHMVQKAMGHSDLRTTLHYEHLVDEDLLQLVSDNAARTAALGA
jgi:integrase